MSSGIEGVGGGFDSNNPVEKTEVRDPKSTYDAVIEDIKDPESKIVMASAIGSGILVGGFALLKTLAAVGLVGAAVGTPVGWAALGVLGVGLLVVGARHVYMESQGENPETLDVLKGSAKNFAAAAVGTYCCVLMVFAGSAGQGGDLQE